MAVARMGNAVLPNQEVHRRGLWAQHLKAACQVPRRGGIRASRLASDGARLPGLIELLDHPDPTCVRRWRRGWEPGRPADRGCASGGEGERQRQTRAAHGRRLKTGGPLAHCWDYWLTRTGDQEPRWRRSAR